MMSVPFISLPMSKMFVRDSLLLYIFNVLYICLFDMN